MSRKIIIPKKELRNLYIRKMLSTYTIAKKYNCDPTVIQNRLRKYNIRLRQPKLKINVPKSLLKDLYLRRCLSTYKIAKILKIGRTTIYMKLIEYGIQTRPKKIVIFSFIKYLFICIYMYLLVYKDFSFGVFIPYFYNLIP